MGNVFRCYVEKKPGFAVEAEHLVTVLMGDRADVRKQYIIDNANFNKVDLFAKEKGVQ